MKKGLIATRGGRGARAQEMSRRPGQGRHPRRLRRRAQVRRQSRTDLAHALRALPGRERPLQGHARGLPQVPHRRQARLRAAPLGLAEGRGALDHRGQGHRRHRASGPLQVHRQRGVRAVPRIQGARRPGGRGRHRQPHARPNTSSTPTRRSSSASRPRAAATSTAPTKVTSTSASSRCCPASSRRSGNCSKTESSERPRPRRHAADQGHGTVEAAPPASGTCQPQLRRPDATRVGAHPRRHRPGAAGRRLLCHARHRHQDLGHGRAGADGRVVPLCLPGRRDHRRAAAAAWHLAAAHGASQATRCCAARCCWSPACSPS